MGKKGNRKNIQVNGSKLSTAATQTHSFFYAGNRKLQRIVLFALSLLIYSATISFDYTLDDTLMITQNDFTKKGFDGVYDIMTNDALAGFLGKGKNLLPGGRYRPLSHVLFAIEYELLGLKKLDNIANPGEAQKQQKVQRENLMKMTGHILNILLYAVLALLIFTVLLRLFQNYEKPEWYSSISFIATLLFVAHPLHTEITCNIKNVDELMSMLGSMTVIYLLFKYIDRKKAWFLVLAAIMYLFAILSKEDSFTFLAAIPLTIFVFTKAKLREHIILFFPLAVSLLIYFAIRYNALGFFFSNEAVNTELLNNPFLNTLPLEKLATVIFTWGIYLKLLFIPYPLTHDYYPYHIAIKSFSDPYVIISIILWLAIIVYAIWKIFKKDIIAYGILFFLITFSISSNLVFNIGAFMNERFVFIPILGFTIVVAWLTVIKIPKLFKKSKYPVRPISALIIIISVIFSVQTFARSFAWKDDYTLFTTDVKTSKNSAKCNVSAGGMIYHKALKENDMVKRNAMYAEAIKYLSRGVEIYPGYIAGWLELGNVFLESKKYPESRNSYETVLKVYPKHPNALNNMLALAQRTAIDSNFLYSNIVYLTLLKYEPQKTDYRLNIAANMVELKRIDTAKIILENIIKEDPAYYKAYGKLGEIYGRYFNDLNTAESFLKKAYEMNQTDPSIAENLGIVNGLKGNFITAIEFLNKALENDPDNPRIYINIAGTYNQMNQPEKAAEYLEKSEKAKLKSKN